jgi:hypothetical protein
VKGRNEYESHKIFFAYDLYLSLNDNARIKLKLKKI